MANKSFQISVDFIGNVSDLQNKVRGLATDINKIGSTSIGNSIQKQFDSLSNTVSQLQSRLKQPITSQAQFDKIVSDLAKVEGGYDYVKKRPHITDYAVFAGNLSIPKIKSPLNTGINR